MISSPVGVQVDLDGSETTDSVNYILHYEIHWDDSITTGLYIILLYYTFSLDQPDCAVRTQMGASGRYLRASAESIVVDAGKTEGAVSGM